MKTILAGAALLILASFAAHTNAKSPVVEDAWAKQSSNEMLAASAAIVQVNHCGVVVFMNDETRTELKARVNLAISKFGEFDVNQRAAQLHSQLLAEKKMSEFCALGLKVTS